VPIVLFNPECEPMGGGYTDREGCLSLPDIFVRIARYGKLKLRALGIGGEKVDLELEGFASRVIQHEVDHLDGVLMVDLLGKAQRMLLHRKLMALDARTKRGWRRIIPDGVVE
ncbi:peptide deformylase, partial [bacterium]|nr:peptide deformylase [bacterium]